MACFAAGKPILLAGGASKSIEEIKVGDTVTAHDPASGQVESRRPGVLPRRRRLAVVGPRGTQRVVTINGGEPGTRRTTAVLSGHGDRWIQLPSSGILLERGEPYLVVEARLGELREYATSVEANHVTVDLADAKDTVAVIDLLKQVLPFPDWCASGWDPIDDAFEELRQGWRFPLIVVVRGLRSLLDVRPHLGMEVVVRLSELSDAFSVAGDQLAVVYVAESWG